MISRLSQQRAGLFSKRNQFRTEPDVSGGEYRPVNYNAKRRGTEGLFPPGGGGEGGNRRRARLPRGSLLIIMYRRPGKVPLTKPSLLQPSSLSSPRVRSGLTTLPRMTLSFILSRLVGPSAAAPSSRASAPFGRLPAASGSRGAAPPRHAPAESGRCTRGTRPPVASSAASAAFLLRTLLRLWFSVGVAGRATSSFSASIASRWCRAGSTPGAPARVS